MSQARGLFSGDRDSHQRGGCTRMSTSPVDDHPIHELVTRAQAGDEKAFEELHRRFFRSVQSFFLKRRCSREEAKDLTQDVFLRVYKSIDTFRGESHFVRWLFEIAHNAWKNELRRKGADKRQGIEEPLDHEGEEEGRGAHEPRASGPSALEVLIERERLEALHIAFGELPRQMRLVCELRFIQQRKYREIADLLKISIETVKAHLHQARKKLALKLGADFVKKIEPPDKEGLES